MKKCSLLIVGLVAMGCGRPAWEPNVEDPVQIDPSQPVESESPMTTPESEPEPVPEPEPEPEAEPEPVVRGDDWDPTRPVVVTDPSKTNIVLASVPFPPPLPEAPKALVSDESVSMRDQPALTLDTSHNLLFKSLTLSEDEDKRLKAILVDRTLASMGEFSPFAGGEEIDAAQNEITARIKALLGDRFEVYETFQATRGERTQLHGIELEDKTALTLVDAMYEQRRTFKFTHIYEGEVDPEALTDEAIKHHFEEYTTVQSNVAVKAGEFLKGEDLERLIENQARWKELEKKRIQNMARRYRDEQELKLIVEGLE